MRPKDLVQLTYLSEATTDMSFLGLMRLLEGARLHNGANGITGILLYDNQQFGQVLEGERSMVLKVWKRIQVDPRHHHIKLLAIEEISERSYPNWSLQFYGGDSLIKEYPALAPFVGGMNQHSLALLNRMRAVEP